jgi:hypothetical protein
MAAATAHQSHADAHTAYAAGASAAPAPANPVPGTAAPVPVPPAQNQETFMTREENVAYLTTNCDCWKGKAKVLANKELFSDDHVATLAEAYRGMTEVVNSVRDAFGIPGANHAQLKVVLTNAKKVMDDEDDDDGGGKKTENDMDQVPGWKKNPKFNKGDGGPEAADGGKSGAKKANDTDEDEEFPIPGKPKGITNTEAAMTDEQWLAVAPPRIRSVVANAVQAEAKEYNDLYKSLSAVANNETHAGRKAYLVGMLKGKPTVNQLRGLHAAFKPVEQVAFPQVHFLGNAGGPNFLTDNSASEDVLPILTMNDLAPVA